MRSAGLDQSSNITRPVHNAVDLDGIDLRQHAK